MGKHKNQRGLIDETGKRYGKLLVVGRDTNRKPVGHWKCICDCGETTSVYGTSLRNGGTTSCSCVRNATHVTHGRSNSSVYNIFKGMTQRCLNENNPRYKRYGGRGIKICDRWHPATPNAFDNFLEDMGERPTSKHSIDRINNDGNYEPENCQWATLEEQGSNKSTNRNLTLVGRTQTLSRWAREKGIKPSVVDKRLRIGWTESQALGFDPAPVIKSTSRTMTYKGRIQTVTQWAQELNLDRIKIYGRLRLGWSDAQALGFETRL